MESVHALCGQDVEVIETHISWVLLAGDFAYKIKKPVKLAFLDFTSLVARRFFCYEELRLNRRTAPGLYLEVVPIAGDPPRIGGRGEPVDYAVKMRRFPQEALLDAMAARGALEASHIDALAGHVAAMHEDAERAPPDGRWDSERLATEPAFENFSEIEAMALAEGARRLLSVLRQWTIREAAALACEFAARRERRFVRECHGDLHLGNVALVDGRPLAFDAIEFSPRLRWIDVMSDVAFLVMDLMKHGEPRLAARFLNAYLERSGDYEGVRVLRFYLVYRAMVRAKVAAIRADAPAFHAYLDVARALAAEGAPALVVMHGPSGSGKTYVSQCLLESMGAVRARSDVERKRMHGFAALEGAASAPGEGVYSQGEGRRAYGRLAEIAAGILEAGFPAVIDATCLERSQRDLFEGVAARARVPLRVVSCAAPLATLRSRVRARTAHRADASDASLAVLDLQLATRQPLGADEHAHAVVLDTTDDAAWKAAVDKLARDLRRDTEVTR
jgi:uncharacterized protein